MMTAFEVAKFFLWHAQQHGDCLTNLKLQKLVYYAQAWHLALYQKPLFKEEIEAWVHGPVVPSLYRRFKDSGWKPIDMEIRSKPAVEREPLLEEVAVKYGRFTGLDLERMTHEETPWIEARGGLSPDESSNATITQDSMKLFFGAKLRRGKN